MHRLRRLSVAKLAEDFIRLSTRLKSSRERPAAPLGSRLLTDQDDVFKHNMWDHVQWTEEDEENALQKAAENSAELIPLKEQGKFDTEASRYWDRFYETHQDKFFKDRRWLFVEFPELLPSDVKHGAEEVKEAAVHTSFPGQHKPFRILEVGCGVGNSVFPIINSIKETGAFLYCCDFSQRAIQLVKEHPDYDGAVCHAFVRDLCEETTSFPFPPRSLDVIMAVFVLSSIHPERIQGVVNRLSTYLKPGGIFLFRDYGRHDFSQLRFKKGRCLSENFYTRGDGTCVYFFTKGNTGRTGAAELLHSRHLDLSSRKLTDEVHDLFSNAGLEEVQNLVDRRLKVNRGKKVVMRRVWMQSKYRKS